MPDAPLPYPENVQRRPGMFVGDTETDDSVVHLIFEILSNAIDEHLSSRATRIDVTADEREVVVSDNGRGLRFGTASEGSNDVFTEMHHTGTRDGHWPHVHLGPGIHGAGLSIVCALCERVVAESHADGRMERRVYSMGRSSGPNEAGPTGRSGTVVGIQPSRSIFRQPIPVGRILERVQELAFMLPGCAFSFNGSSGQGGTLADLAIRLALGHPTVAPPLHVRLFINDVLVDVAATWCVQPTQPTIESFVSTFPTRATGTHVLGLFRGLRRGFAKTPLRDSVSGISSERFRQRVSGGLVAVVHAGLYAPRFGDPTANRLLNPEAQKAVSAAVALALPAYVSQYPAILGHFIKVFSHDDRAQ